MTNDKTYIPKHQIASFSLTFLRELISRPEVFHNSNVQDAREELAMRERVRDERQAIRQAFARMANGESPY